MLRRVPLQPGVNKDDTAYSQETAAFVDADHVRFRRGRAQKIGGFSAISFDALDGTPRGMFAWRDNATVKYLAVHTNLRHYVWAGGAAYNITPIRSTGTLGANPFVTVSGSSAVTVTHTSHGLIANDFVTFSNGDAVGGLDLDTTFQVTSVTNANTYIITASGNASSGATGGGSSVGFSYEATTGRSAGVPGLGWGTSTWNDSTWSSARSATGLLLRTVSSAQFGEDLLFNPRFEGLWKWPLDVTARATQIYQNANGEIIAPSEIGSMFVSPERHVFLLGTNMNAAGVTGSFNPMRVMFSDQEDDSTYITTATNLAGDVVLSEGNQLVAGTSTRLVNLLFTDTALYTARHIGDIDFVYDIQLAGSACGLISPNGFAVVDGKCFWMSNTKQFFVYAGGQPQVIQCTVQDHVFDNLSAAQREKVYASHNSEFNEIWWLYPHDSDECDRYVIYNYIENTWSIGTFDRTAMIDRGVFDVPQMVDSSGIIYAHEDSANANGSAFEAHIETAPMDLEDGERVMELRRIIPDLILSSGGSVDFTVKHRRYPVATETTETSQQVTETTSKLDYRVQARQMSLRISCNGVNDDFRLGDIRMDVTPGGYR